MPIPVSLSEQAHYLRQHFRLGKGGKLFQANNRHILKQIFLADAITQRQICEATRIPQQTASRLINGLIDEQIIVQTERPSDGSRGQPGYYLNLNPEWAMSFGISIRADSVTVILMNLTGQNLANLTQPISHGSVANVLTAIKQMIADIINSQAIDEQRILGAGIGISGYFQALDGQMNTMQSEWDSIDIRALMADELQLPVWVENDGTAAAAGEGLAGIGLEYRNFVYLYLGAGFGGGVIVDGEIHHGAHGNAGELAEILPPKIYLHPNLELLRQILIRRDVSVHSVSDVIAQYDDSWPGIEEWIERVKDSLSLVASCCSAILDTEAVVIGGPIPKPLAMRLLEHVEIHVQHRRSRPRPQPDIVVAKAPGDSVAIGAATLPFRACLF